MSSQSEYSLTNLDKLYKQFNSLLQLKDDTKCINFLDKYSDFCDTQCTYTKLTPLMCACNEDNDQIALYLVDKCKNLNRQNKFGFTDLMYAICKYMNAVIYKILSHDINMNLRTYSNYCRSNCSAFQIACDIDKNDIAIKIMERGYIFVDEDWEYIKRNAYILSHIRTVYRITMQSAMDDESHVMGQCFKTTYVSQLVNIICGFII
ncbi:MAG: hypothetical protein Faunusvirus2_3 [Faunusvirus sp.]|jgi:hypothetical protein|uniref:Uncharacterized protein n=1 Tax=Faunusvirus sp. TaxID=2487766 RepID=A0A3G4ZVZ8_9VIRU|nr:MAG: hypothetical protein Faunusvirus2_3 [Faunusvirus sp.]